MQNLLIRKHLRSLCQLALASFLALPLGASAIIISLVNAGGAQPGNAAGGGSLSSVIGAAASLWEHAILDPHIVTITFNWGAIADANTLAEHSLTAQAGGRETAGSIVFDNDGTSVFFIDPTPVDNSEWSTFTQGFVNNVGGGGGNMNVARFFSGPTGLAAGRLDLFSVALHELGHALGMSSANLAYQAESWPDNDVDVGALLPHFGAQIPTNNSAVPADANTSNAHIPIALHQFVLMNPGSADEVGIRELASCADILANAQISRWTQVDCSAIAPEPSSVFLLGLGLFGIVLYRRYVRQ